MDKSQLIWPSQVKETACKLHADLTLSDKNWHQLKGNPKRRAAELLSSAIVQLLAGGEKSDIEALIEQSLRWLRNEVKTSSCPSRHQTKASAY